MNPRAAIPLDYDAVVVGAGVVGLACAARLAAGGRSVLVVERHASFGRETSSRSSEVIHAGIYYPTGSLKARLCVAANPRLYAYCAERGIPHHRVGKLIVATSAAEEAALDELRRRGEANGVARLAWLSGEEVRRLEPNVIATAALWSPDTGIVDSHALMGSLLASAREHGADVAFRQPLEGAAPFAGGYELVVGETRIRAGAVINAAGLAADEVAALAGIDVDAAGYRLVFVKGSYFRVNRRGLARHLVYPVPLPELRGLGVHLTLDLAGGLRLGPDAEALADRRLDYTVTEDRAPRFLGAASRFLRGLTLADLSPDQAGIRPRLAGSGVHDFVIAEESARGLPRWVNLVGIESPGLTCALEIAERVTTLLA